MPKWPFRQFHAGAAGLSAHQWEPSCFTPRSFSFHRNWRDGTSVAPHGTAPPLHMIYVQGPLSGAVRQWWRHFATPIAERGLQKEEGTGFYPRHLPQSCNDETTANLNLWCKIIKVPFLLQPHGCHCVPQHPRMNSLLVLLCSGKEDGGCSVYISCPQKVTWLIMTSINHNPSWRDR